MGEGSAPGPGTPPPGAALPSPGAARPGPRLSPADADDDVHGASGSRPARLLQPVPEGRGREGVGGPGVSGTGRLRA